MLYFSNTKYNALFEVIAGVFMMIQVFWNMKSIRLVNRFRCLELLATSQIREVHRDFSFVFTTSIIVLPLGTVRPLYRARVSLLSRERFLYI